MNAAVRIGLASVATLTCRTGPPGGAAAAAPSRGSQCQDDLRLSGTAR